MNDSIIPSKQHVYQISELTQLARGLLESHFSMIWIEGEISNFSSPGSGHWYFSLKDASSQVRCAMFRMYNRPIKFMPENGMHVVVRAKVSLYEDRGDFQLIVNYIEEMGLGALQRAFEQLKAKLEKEGLFETAHKKPLPLFPQTIGVVTSPTGAAIKDILSVLKRRYPIANVIIYPTMVQGEQAAEQIVKAIKIANERHECDVLLVSRGGGSLEDLWPFNEEIVARAIFESAIPIVSGVGHEIDFTISDFVADARAPTPSSAAELISPDQKKLLLQLQQYSERFLYFMHQTLQHNQKNLEWLTKRLQRCHPLNLLQQQAQRCDHLEKNLIAAEQKIIDRNMSQFKLLARALNAMNPLMILERGYSVLTNEQNKIIKKSQDIKRGEKIHAKLSDGELNCIVEDVLP